MALYSIAHVLRAEDNLTQIFNDSFSSALANVSFGNYMVERTGLGLEEKLEWLTETLTIDELPNGQMVYADLRSIGHTLVHKDFGKGFKISRNEFHFDKFEKAKEAAGQLGQLAAYHPQTMVESLIKTGTTATGYDTLAFFHATHFVNGVDASNGTFANNATGTALNAANFSARVAAMESRAMPNGISRNIKAKWLVVPPALRQVAYEITTTRLIQSASGNAGVENVLSTYGVVPIVVPGLSAAAGGSDTTWYLFGEHGGNMGKPFIYSRAIDFGLSTYDGVTQAELSRSNEVEWQLRGFVAAAYGHPYLADRAIA